MHHGRPTLGLSTPVVRQFEVLPERARELRLPVLMQHGRSTRSSTRPVAGAWPHLTAPPLTVRWYEGLWHEIHHEPERDGPLGDLREWLAAQR